MRKAAVAEPSSIVSAINRNIRCQAAAVAVSHPASRNVARVRIERGLDRLVVLDPHPLLAVADAQRACPVDERVELTYRARQKGDVLRGGEQGSRGRRQAVQLLVEALDERLAVRLDQPDRDVEETELFGCHEVDGTDAASTRNR